MRAGWVVLAAVSVLDASADPIVIRHDREDARYLALGQRFPAVCRIRTGGAGTLVALHWVLTAAHVARGVSAGDEVVIGARAIPVARVVLHPGWSTPQTNVVDDIALLELATAVDAVSPVPLYRGRDETGRVTTFVGHGGTGNGQSGAMPSDGRLRGATNRVERTDSRWIVFRFDPPAEGATELEGISGPGDSGGPAFLEMDGVIFLAGVSSWQDNRGQGGRQGVYGVLEYYARVSSYVGWIDEVIGTASNPPQAAAQSAVLVPSRPSVDR